MKQFINQVNTAQHISPPRACSSTGCLLELRALLLANSNLYWHHAQYIWYQISHWFGSVQFSYPVYGLSQLLVKIKPILAKLRTMSYIPSKIDPWTLLLLLDSAVMQIKTHWVFLLAKNVHLCLPSMSPFLLFNELFSVMHYYDTFSKTQMKCCKRLLWMQYLYPVQGVTIGTFIVSEEMMYMVRFSCWISAVWSHWPMYSAEVRCLQWCADISFMQK